MTPYINRYQRPTVPCLRTCLAASNARQERSLGPSQTLWAKLKRSRPSPSLLLPPHAAGCSGALPSEIARARLGSQRVVGCRQLSVHQACQWGKEAWCVSHRAWARGAGAGEVARSHAGRSSGQGLQHARAMGRGFARAMGPAHLECGREVVEHRNLHRGIEPRCMTEVRGKSPDPG